MGDDSSGKRACSQWSRATIVLAAIFGLALVVAPMALAGTPSEAQLAIPFPPAWQYMFSQLDESDGTVVFALPSAGGHDQIYAWTETGGLSILTTGGQDSPAIDGKVVVWVDGSTVKGCNLATGDTFDVGDGTNQCQPSVSGDWVVWTENYHEIHAYNIVTHVTRTLSTGTSLKQCPRICGDVVVWMDKRDDFFYSVWGCRLSSGGEFAISEGYGDRSGPDTDGRYVVWSDQSVGAATGVCGYDLVTGTSFVVSPPQFPVMKQCVRISDGLVTWSWGGGYDSTSGISARRLPSGAEFQVCDGGRCPVPDGNAVYHVHGTTAWRATLHPIAGSLSVHAWTGTPGYSANATVTLDVAANSDAGTITDMDFGGGWEPTADTKVVGPLADGWQTIKAKVRDDAGNVSEISSKPFYVDTVAPVTSWFLTLPHETTPLTPGWFNSDVVLHLDVDDASGVGTVYSQIGSGAWMRGGPLRFDARANHANDGWYTVHVSSKDAAGNVEGAPQTIEFGIDTQPPAAVAVLPAIAQRGQVATLRFRVRDGGVTSGRAAVRIVIFDRSGRRVARLSAARVSTNTATARRFLCRLPRGTYRFGVKAIDTAGNRALRTTFNRLVVQ